MQSQDASDFLRGLVFELASLLPPIHWRDFHSVATGSSSRLLRREDGDSLDVSPSQSPEKRLTPQLSQLLGKMLRLFHHSLELVASGDARPPLSAPPQASQRTTEPRVADPAAGPPAGKSSTNALENDLLRLAGLGRQVLDQVDVNAILSTAFVAAVYEHIGIVESVDLSSSTIAKLPLGPTVFWSGNNDASHHHHNDLVALQDDALGDEMYLQTTK